ncbi:MAG: hypothetical protein E7420_08865 [Ruminococcaceae bacterium]|nr:hypothetical protein [Oscillospiraceae bacterium]
MYEIIVCPIKRLYQLAEDADMSEVAVIAVSSYEIKKEKLAGFYACHCMNFADIANADHPSAFNAYAAAETANFIKALPENLDTLFACCDSGESRSAAMAAAIMRFLHLDEMRIWTFPGYHPNKLVYLLLCEALGVSVSPEEAEKKSEISSKALKKAINKN